jgi:hypothetical protein
MDYFCIERPSSSEGGSVFEALTGAGKRCAVIDKEHVVRRLASGVGTGIVVKTDARALAHDDAATDAIVAEVRKPLRRRSTATDADAADADAAGASGDGADVVFAHLYGYYEHLEESNKRWAAHTGRDAKTLRKRPKDDGDAAAEGAEGAEEEAAAAAEEEEDAYDDVEESIAADAALMDLDVCVGKVWDALPSNSMLILATGVGDSPRLRTLQERKWKRVQGIGPWGPWTEDADAELKRAAERCRAGVAFAAVKP